MRRKVLAAPALLVIAWAGAACTSGGQASPAWGTFTERGLDNVAMVAGANIRVFNDVTLPAQDAIAYDDTNGYLTLQPGTYRVDGWSLTTFGYELTPEEQAATFSAPGYAFVWNVDEESIAILGSMQDPLLGQPSIVDGILDVTDTTQYYLAHQNGRTVDGLSLQVYDPDAQLPDGTVSTDHAFAQLVVERI